MNQKHFSILAVAGVLLCAASSAHAITVAGLDPNLYSVAPGGAGGAYTGVAELLILRPDLGSGMIAGCSGSLLSDGYSILTAAHCIADSRGVERATNAYVIFNLAGGAYVTQAANFFVDPEYTGQILSPNDVAVLSMAAPAPGDATRYDLFTGASFNQIVTLAGYGFGGNGLTGYDVAAYPFGTLRVGRNQYDAYVGPNQLGFDFDDGTAANDTFGNNLGIAGLGLGTGEAFLSPGDSGGPSFINGQIAGVHSFIGRLGGGNLDSCFGEFAGDASTLYNENFIQSVMVTPEPNTIFMLGIALVVFALLGPKRRRGRRRPR